MCKSALIAASSCPHARGGGPSNLLLVLAQTSLSPRTWGWTYHLESSIFWGSVVPTHVGVDLWEPNINAFAVVVPTHVGVDLRSSCGYTHITGCPHARGGGPARKFQIFDVYQLSPRTWGWTYTGPSASRPVQVVPTHVGVDLPCVCSKNALRRCPHARGGGPSAALSIRPGLGLSPRTWGWTVSSHPRQAAM